MPLGQHPAADEDEEPTDVEGRAGQHAARRGAPWLLRCAGGGGEVFDGGVGEGVGHEVVPDEGGDGAAVDGGVAFDVGHRCFGVWVADPDAGGELGDVAAEPGVDVVFGGAG